MKQKKKLETLDDLVEVIQRTMASKEDLVDLATKEDLKNLATKTELMAVKFELNDHIRDLAHDINKIDRKLEGVPSLAEFNELRERLERVEKKVGIK